ncbi:MAG: hypothetical protein ACQET8_17425 [Bacillota bacterium]
MAGEPLRDTKILFDVMTDADPLREVNNQINGVIKNSRKMGDSYGAVSETSQKMLREMKDGFKDQRDAMMKWRNDLVGAEYGFYLLSKRAKDYDTTTGNLMRSINSLGATHKTASDAMLKNDDRMKMSIYRTIGVMGNMSTQAEKTWRAINLWKNPIYLASAGSLSLLHNLQKVAQAANPAAMALKRLGKDASAKDLADEITRLNRALGVLPIAYLIAGLGAMFFYGAVHKAAMENEEYAKTWKTMLKTLREAIQPMIDVFIMIMIPVYKFITAIGQMIIKFNEAHPTLAKIIQGFLLLIPALTVLLLPMGLGIGLVNGYAMAFGYLMRMIGPIITFFATLTPVVWIVAAAIVGLTAAVIWAWENVDWFRNGVTEAWDLIKLKTVELKDGFIDLKDKGIQYIKDSFKEFKTTIEENEDAIKGIAITLGLIFGPALIKTGLQAIIAGGQIALSFTANLIKTGVQAGISATIMIGQFIVAMLRTAAQAVLTGGAITVSLIGALIRYAVQGWMTVAAITAQTTAWLAQRTVALISATATGVVTAAQWALNAAIWANPITWLIGLIIVLIAIGVALYKNWDTVVQSAQNLWSGITTAWSKVEDSTDEVWYNIKSAVIDSVNGIVDSINDMIRTINKIPGVNVPIVPKISQPRMPQSMITNKYQRVGGAQQHMDGSHKNGLDRVPFDGYKAILHKNEAVLTAEEADALRSTGSLNEGGSYTPEGSTITTNNTKRSLVFNPQINVETSSGSSADIKQQVKEAMEESYSYLLSIYDLEEVY